MRLALIVEYDGTDYSGFQFQKEARSVQEELEKAISRFTGEDVRVTPAGRTDAGVHAEAQVVAFDTATCHSSGTVVRALNYYLPEDIAVKSAYRAEDGFDPRRQALSRTYRYTILNAATPSPLLRHRAHRVAVPLDAQRMDRAARIMVGPHDFAGFAGNLEDPRASTVREVFEASVNRAEDTITIEVRGSSFLPHQVRRMAGAMIDVGRGALTLEDVHDLLSGGPAAAVAHSAPPQGLCLVDVKYENFPPENGE